MSLALMQRRVFPSSSHILAACEHSLLAWTWSDFARSEMAVEAMEVEPCDCLVTHNPILCFFPFLFLFLIHLLNAPAFLLLCKILSLSQEWLTLWKHYIHFTQLPRPASLGCILHTLNLPLSSCLKFSLLCTLLLDQGAKSSNMFILNVIF